MSELYRELRYAARKLVSRPGFTAAAVLSLALGIGANTAIFAALKGIFLQPLPVSDPSELVSVYTVSEDFPGYLPVSFPNFEDFRDRNTVFSHLTTVTGTNLSLYTGGEPEIVAAGMVSGNYFDTLGVQAVEGRTFLPEEDLTPGSHPVAVLSHGLWQRRFGADPSIVGRTIELEGQPFTVVGVAPRGFTGINAMVDRQLWVPLMMYEQVMPQVVRPFLRERRAMLLGVVGRLAPGVSIERAEAEMEALSTHLAEEFPDANQRRTTLLVPLRESMISPNSRDTYVRAGVVMAVMVGLVLVVACANVANMLLVRASSRREEIAVRLALGARRGRLVRQLLTESLLLALVGGAAGLVVTVWSRRLLEVIQSPFVPPSLELRLDPGVLAFALGLSLVTGVVFGLAPALQSTRPDLVSSLKEEPEGGAGAGRGGGRLRNLLVAGQVALSLISLVAAALFLLSLRNAQEIDVGFPTDRLVVLGFDLDGRDYTEERGQGFLRRVVEKVESLPGVRSAAVAQNLMLATQGLRRTIAVDGHEAPDRSYVAQVNSVGEGYFETLGVELVEGRAFDETDRADTRRVAVVNRTMAEQFWPGGSALGKRFRFVQGGEEMEIVGVSEDVKYNTLGEDPQHYTYLPVSQVYTAAVTLHARTEVAPTSLVEPVRRQVQSLDPSLPLVNVRTMDDVLEGLLWAPRAGALLLALFGGMSLLLAVTGIYSVTSYTVSERRREVGIRVALGALRSQVLGLFVSRGMTVIAAGIGAGVVATYLLGRLLSNLLYGLDATQPAVYGVLALTLGAVGLLAILLAARRASRLAPMAVIRRE